MTKFLEKDTITANYDLEGKLCRGFKNLDWVDNKKIEEAIATTKDNEDKLEDFWKKNKILKRKAEKKACLEAKKAKNNKKASNSKDVNFLTFVLIFPNLLAFIALFFGLFAHTITAFHGFLAPVAAFPGFFAPIATSLNLFALLLPSSVFLLLLLPLLVC